MSENRPGGVRIGDREREDAVKRLGEHYEAGRLSADEHTERVGAALQAKTAADLAALFVDLPGRQPAGSETAGDAADEQEWAGWPGGPGWAGRGSRVPVPLLIALAALAAFAAVGCVVLGGHPPVLPLLLIVAAVVFVVKRRPGQRA